MNKKKILFLLDERNLNLLNNLRKEGFFSEQGFLNFYSLGSKLDNEADYKIINKDRVYKNLSFTEYDILVVFSFFKILEIFKKLNRDQKLIIIDQNFLTGFPRELIGDQNKNKRIILSKFVQTKNNILLSAFRGLRHIYLNSGFSEEKIRFYYNCFDLDFKNELTEIEMAEPYIFSGGKEKRDFASLVEAYQGIKSKLLIITSKKDYPWLFTQKLKDGVILKDRVPFPSFLSYLQKSKFVVLPLENSVNTTQGLSVMSQAMAFGKCVLIADLPCIKGYVKNFFNGVLYRAGDANDLREKILFLENNPAIVNKIGNYARKFAQKNMNFQVLTDLINKEIKNFNP